MSYLVNPYRFGGGGVASWTTAQTDGFTAGGGAPSTMAPQDYSQSYNGTTWTSKAVLPAGRSAGAGGGNTVSFIQMGGDTNQGGNWGTSPQLTCFTYVGGTDTWTTRNSMNTATNFCMGGGTPDTAIIFTGTYSNIDTSQTWDGSNWTTNTVYPTGSRGSAGDGNSTDAIGSAGYDGSYFYDSYIWDASSWTKITDPPTDKMQGDSCSCGLSNNFISGWSPSGTGGCYMWDATTWTQTASSNYDHRATFGGDKTFCFKVGTDAVSTDSEYYNGTADTWTSSGASTWTIRAGGGSGANT